MAIHPNWKRTCGAGCSLLLLSFILKHSDNKGLAALSWVGGGSILIGGYKVVVEAVDFLDQIIDQLYWNRRKPMP
jgi:hypothetical protein